jgi:hypothetical protein
MKEATGELNMTVITLVAITAIAAVFYFVVYPIVQRALVTQTCRSAYGATWTASTTDTGTGCVPADDAEGGQRTDTGNDTTEVRTWFCCPTAQE